MYKIYYDREQFSVLIDGVQNSSGILDLEREKSYILTLLPIYDKTLFVPISSVAKLNNNKLICSIPHIKLDKDQYYLMPKFAPYLPPHSPHVDIQREFGDHTITVYTDNLPKLLIENKSNFISVTLPCIPDKLQEAVLDNGVLFYCLAPNYLCVIFYDYNDYSVLIDKECESYTFDENGIEISVHLNDNQGRIYTSHLSFNEKEYICDKEQFDYSNYHTPNEKLVGYDFLQGLMAEDFNYCEKMLSSSCNTTLEDISKKLENMEELIIPNCPIKNNSIFIKTADDIVKCSFKIKSGMIEAIYFK